MFRRHHKNAIYLTLVVFLFALTVRSARDVVRNSKQLFIAKGSVGDFSRVSAEHQIVNVNFEGLHFKLVLKPLAQDGVSREIAANGVWDKRNSAEMLRLLKPQDGRKRGTLVDIGANIGWFSMLALAAGHKVIAIDAFPDNIEMIKLSAQINNFKIDQDQFTLISAAVGSPAGYCQLVSGDDNVADGMLACSDEELEEYNRQFYSFNEGVGPKYYKPRAKVPVAHLDTLVKEKHVDVLKIDIEGHEPQALRPASAGNFFRSSKVKALLTEFIPWVSRSSGLEPYHYLELLQAWGFSCTPAMSQEHVNIAAAENQEFDLTCLTTDAGE